MLRTKPWSGLLDALGPADSLPSWIDRARDPVPRKRRKAHHQLAQRLLVPGSWVSAAPKAAEILVADALAEDTPDRAKTLDLLRRMLTAGTEPAPEPDPIALELREVLTHRIDDLVAIVDDDPDVRRACVQLLDPLDGPLPVGPDPDPAVDIAIAIARARRGLDVMGRPPAQALASLSSTLDPEGVIAVLAGDRSIVPIDGDLAEWVGARLESRPDEGAALFAQACTTHPDHPDLESWASQVGRLAFPSGLQEPPTGELGALLATVLAAPLPRDALGISGLPPRRDDARRWLGLDPPGPWETVTDDGPLWEVMDRCTDDPDAWLGLPLPPDECLALAGQTMDRPYWLEPASAEVLTVLAERAERPTEWARSFLETRFDAPEWLGPEPPPHANVALMQLVTAREDIAQYAERVSFADIPERTARLLAALPRQRDDLVLAYLLNPNRPDFQDLVVLQRAMPHMGPGSQASLEAVLRRLEGSLSMVLHPPEFTEVLRSAMQWATRFDRSRFQEWRSDLLGEERERLEAILA